MRNAPFALAPSPPLEVALHRGDLAGLAPDWRQLCDPAHPGAPFRSWAWSSAWWQTFSAGREAFVLVARRAGQIVGLLPLYQERSPLGGRRLGLFGEGIVGSDYLGAICRPRDESAVCAALADALGQVDCDELCLDGLADDDPLLTCLAKTAGSVVEPRYLCPQIRLEGDFASYLAARPGGLGHQFARRRRWLERQPGFTIVEHREPEEIVAALDTLFALHYARWGGASEAIDGPPVERFHRRAAGGLAAQGWARLTVLHLDGAPRAALYGFRHGERFAFYQAGYDPALRQRSVGTVLLGHLIERAFADGLREFDFLRGSEPYKLAWANDARHTVRLRAHDGSLRARTHRLGHFAYHRLRDAGKRALPAPALAWARRARKVWS